MTFAAFNIPGYELKRELGEGGMATVFLAVQRSLDRKVAIKVMRRGAVDESGEKRFLIEGRTLARLPHPNIVGVFDIVQNDEINYIAMEFLEGGMLSDKMKQGLSLAEAISIVVQISGALQYAHDSGIVHRDLKPANIMFRDAATPVLTDFGIARQQNSEATRLTQTGMMIGTPTYMSPEQATGGDLDGRSDQYALGVLFYEMLTGGAPFVGDTPLQVVLAHLNTPAPPLPAQFSMFQPLLDRLLAKNREQRYPDLRVFSKELKSMVTGNEALLKRLRIDPAQSASEQLRALGFSDSQIHTGGVMAPPPRPIVSQRMRATSSSAGPGVLMGDSERQRPRWLIPVVVGAVLAVGGVGSWMLIGREPTMDPVLRNMLNRELVAVDKLIQDSKLVSPPGDNAYERLQEVLQLAPEDAEARKRLNQIGAVLRTQAEKAVNEKRFAVAEARIGEALAVLPDNARALQLKKRIDTAKIAEKNQSQVSVLLVQAETARKANNLVGESEDNALALLRQAMEIDPQSKTAQAALAQLTEQVLQAPRRALENGQIDQAERALEASSAYFASEPAWQQLLQRVEATRQQAADRKRIDTLIAQARAQMQAGKIAEPAGDNALETLARVTEVDAANSTAKTLRAESAAALAKLAQKAAAAGDAATALDRYDQALQAAPGDPRYTAAKLELEKGLGERQAQVQRTLTSASEAITARNYFAPAASSAKSYLDQVLKLDPNNARAQKLLAELPNLARVSAEQLAAEGHLDDALKLLADAQPFYPGNTNLAQLIGQLKSEQSRATAVKQRSVQLTRLQELLAKRSLDVDSTRAIATAIKTLLGLDPNDSEALRYRNLLFGGVTRAIAAYDSEARLAGVTPIIEQLRQQFGSTDSGVAELDRLLKERRTTVLAAEQARLASLSGTLLLNAQPWANVVSVIDQSSGKPVALPQDASTPLRLTVPAGTYKIGFRHPNVAVAQFTIASLQPKQNQNSNAVFKLSAADYLKRSGYAQ